MYRSWHAISPECHLCQAAVSLLPGGSAAVSMGAKNESVRSVCCSTVAHEPDRVSTAAAGSLAGGEQESEWCTPSRSKATSTSTPGTPERSSRKKAACVGLEPARAACILSSTCMLQMFWPQGPNVFVMPSSCCALPGRARRTNSYMHPGVPHCDVANCRTGRERVAAVSGCACVPRATCRTPAVKKSILFIYFF